MRLAQSEYSKMFSLTCISSEHRSRPPVLGPDFLMKMAVMVGGGKETVVQRMSAHLTE